MKKSRRYRIERDSRPLNSLDWELSDRFADLKLRMRCRILSWADGMVNCERWMARGKKRVRFSLQEKFWLGASCGWRKVPFGGGGS